MNQIACEMCEPFIPKDVALMVVKGNMPLVKAWRIRLNMSLEEIAAAAGLIRGEVEEFEAHENRYSRRLLDVARAMNLDIDQLVDIIN